MEEDQRVEIQRERIKISKALGVKMYMSFHQMRKCTLSVRCRPKSHKVREIK